MKLLYILLSLYIVFTNSYKTYNLFRTKLTSNEQIIDKLTNPDFFNYYLRSVNAKDVIWIPPINSSELLICPQEIKYRTTPNVKMYPKTFPKITINHYWLKENDFFYGNVSSKYLTSELLLRPVKYDRHYCGLLVHAEIKNKKCKFIPNTSLNEMIMEFGKCFKTFCSIDT